MHKKTCSGSALKYTTAGWMGLQRVGESAEPTRPVLRCPRWPAVAELLAQARGDWGGLAGCPGDLREERAEIIPGQRVRCYVGSAGYMARGENDVVLSTGVKQAA